MCDQGQEAAKDDEEQRYDIQEFMVFAKTLHGIMAEMASTATLRNAQKLEAELKDIVLNGIRQKVDEMLISDKTFSNYLSKLQSKRMDPFVAGDKITKKLLGGY